MSQGHQHDPSTLASLHPTQPRELHYKGFRNAIRLHGSHFMALRRPSKIPESGREYVPGDPVNLVDWKAFARTDQLIIREVRDEATARIVIGADLSETMLWPVPGDPLPAPPPTKAEVALRVAFNLAHVHLRMGDLVEVWAVFDGKEKLPAHAFRPRSPADLVAAFLRAEAGRFAAEACRAEFAPKPFDLKMRDCAFWVGDALGGADVFEFLAQGRRSLLFHVLSSLELDIGWTSGDTSYFDEGAGRKEYQGQVLRHRDNYAKHLAGWRQKLAAKQRKRGGDYLTCSDRTKVSDYQATLGEFLAAV